MAGETADDHDDHHNILWDAVAVSNKSDVPKRLFLVVVMFIAIAPRMPLEEPLPMSIGGNLSNMFRKLVLVIGLCSLLRNTFFKDCFDGLSLVLVAFEGVSLTFLSLLTPYLLRVWMEDRINIPGSRQPGKGLMPWVQSFVVLSLIGVILRTLTHKMEFWIFKKVADMLSFIPVMRTLQLYNSITTAQVRYPGRGSVLSQVVVVAEFYSLFANGCDVLSKALEILGVLDAITVDTTDLMQGIYLNVFYANYTRVLCHSVMLNVLDEAYTIGSSGAASAGCDDQDEEDHNDASSMEQDGPIIEMVDDENDDCKQMVALVPRSRSRSNS